MTDRRTPDPGRRGTDDAREEVANEVLWSLEELVKQKKALRDELVELRRDARLRSRRWLVVWLLTLGMSGLSIYLAGSAASDVGKQAETAKQTAADARKQSLVSCNRSRVFGPEIASAYEKYKILSSDALAEYRKTIPKTCP